MVELRVLLATLLLAATTPTVQTQEHNGIEGINGILVKCHTTAANGAAFVLEIKPEWAPLGAERFLQLVESGYFTDVPFFRVATNFLTQFGIPPPSEVRKKWQLAGPIQDDPSQNRKILRGYLSFAGGGPNTRDSQLFIALADSDFLGKAPWEVPLGRVIEGMDSVIDQLYSGYGEIFPFNKAGVDQGKIWTDPEYLQREFPKLDYFKDCSIIPASVKKDTTAVEAKVEEKKKKAVVAAAVAADVAPAQKDDQKEAQSAVPALGVWGLLCIGGGLMGFWVLMRGLKDVKSAGKGT